MINILDILNFMLFLGNHSSEEELEEINTNKKTYLEPERDCKRKWTDLSQSDASCESDTEFEDPELRLEVKNLMIRTTKRS